jgi:hypothetical protein
VLLQIKSMKEAGLSGGIINKLLILPGVQGSPFVNHWQRGMFQALIIEESI